MKPSDTNAIVENCIHGTPAACSYMCPFGLDARDFLQKAKNGKWAAAYKALRNAVLFPVVVSHLCPAPCKSNCLRGGLGDEAVELPLIERAVIEYTKNKTPVKYVIPPKEQSVAVIGAGASGLACALDLAQKRYLVTLFDKQGGWGGKLREHENFKLFDEDFQLQFEAVELNMQFGKAVTDLNSLSEFDAIYLATGVGGDEFGLLESFNAEHFTTKQSGVFMGGGLCAKPLMESISMGISAARHIAVFLQTGKVDAAVSEKKDCSKHVVGTDEPRMAKILPSPGCGYTQEEAKSEASRCMGCDCSSCMDSCEMLHKFRKKPRKIATEVYTDTQVSSTFSTRTLTRQTYSCNMCSSCKSVCPEGIDMGELFAMSRRDRFESGAAPLALHDYWLRELDFNTSSASFFAAPEDTCQYVFYPGCQLGAYKPEHVFSTYEFLKNNLNCGIYLGCCGAPAFWAGDNARCISNAQAISGTAKTLGNPVFILACTTCQSMFKEFLPGIKTISLYKFLSENAGLSPSSPFKAASVFDPCSARDDSESMAAVRQIAHKAGASLTELPASNLCCGYGGLVRGGNPGHFKTITQARASMSENPYIVYCANCREVFASQGKACVHVLDIAFGLNSTAEIPPVSEKRRNSLYVKSVLMKELNNEVFEPQVNPWDNLTLVIDKELFEQIDRKLISEDDMKEVIYRAQLTGEKFIYESDGSYTACLRRRVLTYWVKYRILSETEFEIKEAYYHRMSFGETEG